MTKPKKEKAAKTRQTHVYLTEEDFAELEKRAIAECRSVTGQILFYVRERLADKKPQASK